MPFTLPLDEMTQEEKLSAMETLYLDLSSPTDDSVFPAWHEEVLRERLRAAEAGEAHSMSWEESQKYIDELLAGYRAASNAQKQK